MQHSFEIERAPFLAAIKRVVGAVESRSTLPILSYVKVDILLRGVAILSASDLEVFATSECPVEIKEGHGCSFCVPAKKIQGAVAVIPDEKIILGYNDEQKVSISGDGLRYSFDILGTDEFPVPVSNDESLLVEFSPGALGRMINSVIHAVSRDDTKYNLGGINIFYEDGSQQFTMAATDGHRLSVVGLKNFPGVDVLKKSTILPFKAAGMIAKIVGTVSLSADSNTFVADSPGINIAAKFIDGEFPEFRRVIPNNNDLMIAVNRSKLIEALVAVGVVEEKSRCITLVRECDQLEVRALGDSAICTATINCEGDDGLRFSVSSKFLLQALRALDGEDVLIKYNNDDCRSVAIYQAAPGGWDERVEVIMGMRE